MTNNDDKKYLLIIIALAIVFAVIYSYFFIAVYWQPAVIGQNRYIFSWPDAMANNFFIDNFISKSNFNLPEPINPVVNNIIHPRSTNVTKSGDIVPMAFLGFPLTYGLFGQLVGSFLIKFLTPFLAATGGILFYLIIKRIFTVAIALISTILLFTLATYWYYADLVMLPTVFFIFLILCAAYFYLRQRERIAFSALSGFFFGLALITRGVEFIPIGLIIVVPLFFYRADFNTKKIFIFLFSLLLPIGLLLYVNYLTYSEPFTLGYLNSNSELALTERLPTEMQVKADDPTVLSFFKFIFIPFGLHELKIAENFFRYFIKFLLPYVALFIIGLGFLIRDWRQNKLEQKQFIYCLTGALVSGWLIFYYGNWDFIDPLVVKNNTIGSSYARYWLLPNIIILPVIASFLCRIWQKGATLIQKILWRSAVAIIIVCLIWFSAGIVFKTPGDGLSSQAEIIKAHYSAARKVESIIPKNAIIITDRTDKLFFPDYRIIDFNLNYAIFPELKKIISQFPIFYLSDRIERDIEYINEEKISTVGLRLGSPIEIDSELTLYRLTQL